MADRTVLVKLRADTAAFKRSMTDAAGSMKGLDAEQAKAQKRAAMWSAVGKASTAAGIGIAAGLLATTKAASNQEQALGALNAVFKVNTQAMVDNAKGATRIGLSTTQYANSAAKLGAQLGNLGVDQQDLGATTDDLIKKAADMAAQFGGPTSQAVDAISAALRGERDPIEQYGVTLTETGIKAEMAATGLDKTAATLSLLNKQLASSGTIGAAAREFDTTAAATQRMRAEFENAQAALGDALLPVMTTAAGAASDLLGWFNSLPKGVQEATTYTLALGAALGMVGPKALAAGRAIQFYAMSLAAYSKGAGAVLAAAKGFAPMALAAFGLYEVGKAIQTWQFGTVTEDIALLQRQLQSFSTTGVGDIGRFGNELGTFREDMAHIAETMDNAWVPPWAGWSMGPILDELAAMDSALVNMAPDEAAAAFEKLKEQALSTGMSLDMFLSFFPKYQEALSATGVAAGAAGVAQAAMARWMDTATASAQREADALQALKDDISSVMQAQLALVGAEDALYGARQRMRDAIEANGKSLDRNSASGRVNRGVVMQEAAAILSYGKALEDSGVSAEAADAAVRQHMGALRQDAIAAGFSKQQVDALLRSILDLPPGVDVDIALRGAAAAQKELRGVAKAAADAARDLNPAIHLFGGPKAKKGLDDVTRAANKVPDKKNVKTDSPGAKATETKMKQVMRSVFGVPDKKDVKTDAPGAQGTRGDLDNVRGAANSIPGSKTVSVYTSGVDSAISQLYSVAAAAADEIKTVTVRVQQIFAEGGPVFGYASGGPRRDGAVHGPGTSTSDSVPAMLSAGEFVMSAAAVRKYGLGAMMAMNAGKLPGFRRGGKVDDLIDPATGKRYVWADQRWIEYHPAPRLPKGPDERPVWDKPDPRKGETKAEYRARVEKKRRRFERKMERYQRRKDVKDERKALIEQEKLDHKWKMIDEARARALEEYNKRVEEAQQRLDDIVQQREDFQAQIMAGITGDWMGTFDFSKAEEATERLTEAQKALAEARKAVATAAPEDRAQALADVAAARKDVEEARRAAAAAKATPENVLKSFRDRARQAQEYTASMQNLTGRGVSKELLRELALAGPEQSADMRRALAAMTQPQIRALNAQIAATRGAGLSLADFLGTEFYGDDEAAARRALQRAQQNPPPPVTVNIAAAEQPIALSLDSRDIWRGQLRLRRRTGNTYTFERA